MRRRGLLPMVLLLWMALAAGLAPGLTAASPFIGFWGEGLTFGAIDADNPQGETQRAHWVRFNPGAFVPEEPHDGAMVVKVERGTFAFRAQEDVIVDPQGSYIQILDADPDIEVGQAPAQSNQRYLPTGMTVPGCVGAPPTVLCLINSSILDGNYVRLEPGFTVYLPDDTTCFFCNLAETDDGAELVVWAPASGFSWQQKQGQFYAPPASPSPSPSMTPSATPSASDRSGRFGWTRLNPGSPCH